MSSYVLSNANRFYVAIEPTYGQAALITPDFRFPAKKLQAKQVLETNGWLPKTGSRTFLGGSSFARKRTAFQLRTYLTCWSGANQPGYGPLFQATMGAAPQLSMGIKINAAPSSTQFQTFTEHNLTVGCGVAFAGEIRFVSSVINNLTFKVNAPFTTVPNVNDYFLPSVTYRLSTDLPSVSLYDYWGTNSIASRIIVGAAINDLKISINGDHHDFIFSGDAADIVDTSSFQPGMAGIDKFPSEPTIRSLSNQAVPGHLGQIWIGETSNQLFTLTEASVQINNSLELRRREFGSIYPKAIVPGNRLVQSSFSVLAQESSLMSNLYRIAKERTSIPILIQLGRQPSQLMGIYMPSVTPELPDYVDSDVRLTWSFNNNIAQGIADDEVYVAFA